MNTPKPIERMLFIPTVPRSGSSALAGFFHASGAFFGVGATPHEYNAKGIFEFMKIDTVFSSRLQGISSAEIARMVAGEQPAPEIPFLYCRLAILMADAGYAGGLAGFKSVPRFAAFWRQINAEFPGCLWLLPRRNIEDTAKGMLRIGLVSTKSAAYQRALDWKEVLDALFANAPNCIEVDMDAVILRRNYGQLQLAAEAAGIAFDQALADQWFDDSLYRLDLMEWRDIDPMPAIQRRLAKKRKTRNGGRK
jgi:hypothetical protein